MSCSPGAAKAASGRGCRSCLGLVRAPPRLFLTFPFSSPPFFPFLLNDVHDVNDPGTPAATHPPLPSMAARHRPSRSQEGYLSPSPPADMAEPFHNRNYYDNDAEHSETFHRDNYGSESSAAGLNDYDQPDPYGSSFSLSHVSTIKHTFLRSTRYRFGSRCLRWPAVGAIGRVFTHGQWARVGANFR